MLSVSLLPYIPSPIWAKAPSQLFSGETHGAVELLMAAGSLSLLLKWAIKPRCPEHGATLSANNVLMSTSTLALSEQEIRALSFRSGQWYSRIGQKPISLSDAWSFLFVGLTLVLQLEGKDLGLALHLSGVRCVNQVGSGGSLSLLESKAGFR